VDMQAVFTEATRWDVEHEVTAHWKKFQGAQAVVAEAEHNYEHFRADLLRFHPYLTDGQIAELIAATHLAVVECRAHVQDALTQLAATGELGVAAEQVLRGRLRLARLAASLFG
jgi:hypothetical protein